MSHTWVYHPEIDQYWLCPDGALEDQLTLGWRQCEAPPEPNPAVAERIAFERQLRQQAEKDTAEEPDDGAEDREEKTTTKTRPRRGTSENEEG